LASYALLIINGIGQDMLIDSSRFAYNIWLTKKNKNNLNDNWTNIIKDLVILTPKIFNDERGCFEAYNQATFYENGIKHEFIQDNQSFQKRSD
jgi:hypothetical protein